MSAWVRIFWTVFPLSHFTSSGVKFTSPHVAERIITKEKKPQYAMGFTHLQCTADRKYLTEQDYKENIVEFRSKR